MPHAHICLVALLLLACPVRADDWVLCPQFGTCPPGCVEVYDCDTCEYLCVTKESAQAKGPDDCWDCPGAGCLLTLQAAGCFPGSPGCPTGSFEVGELITVGVDAVESFPDLMYDFAITQGCGLVDIVGPYSGCFAGRLPVLKLRALAPGTVTVTVIDSNHPCDLPCDPCTVIDVTFQIAPSCCPADLDGNGSIGFGDLNLLLAAWGLCDPESCCQADISGDGQVGIADLNALLAAWGETCGK